MEQFQHELKQFGNRWKKGLALQAFIRVAGWAALCWAALCWLDLLLAFDAVVRIVLVASALTGLGIRIGWDVWRIVRIKGKDTAKFADTLTRSRRREILSAWEIGRALDASSPLTFYLTKKSIQTASDKLESLKQVPLNKVPAKILKTCSICLMLSLLPALINPKAALTLSGRFLLPFADIPPYSPYVFNVSPDSPRVIYGDDLVIHVAVAGKEAREPVRFATRKNGQILESACYKADANTYMQRLERVMQPMEFCFTLGRARSRWHRIEVLYQPHVLSAKVRLTSPGYANIKEKTFDLGTEPIAGLKGTRVEMTVQSNRPLKNGSLTIAPLGEGGSIQTVPGNVSGSNEITCVWEIGAHATLSLMIHDILGTPAKEPLKIRQELIPDEKPLVSLSEPSGFSLATPGIKLPFYASLDDDLGLEHCEMFRALKGYRSRAVSLDLEPGSRSQDVQGELDLARLGVEPGQVIELFLSVRDTNPELTGIGSSDIARIKIISEDDYARMVRAQTTIEDFENRFQAIADHYTTLVRDLEHAKEMLENGRLTGPERQDKTAEARNSIKKTAASVRELARDFAAFDLEKRLAESAEAMAGKLDIAADLEGWDGPNEEDALAALSESIAMIKGLDQTSQALERDAKEIAAVSRVLAMAARYKTLIDRQLILVGSLRMYAAGEREASKPRVFAEQETAIREDFEAMIRQLDALAGELPEGYESLKESSLDFVKKARSLSIPDIMKSCENACINEQPREAWNYASLALEAMQDLIASCGKSPFAQACSGKLSFRVPDRLSQTMSQMLESLMQQFNRGAGWGQGTGAAGMGLAGAWEGSYLSGYSAFSFPVYGPERKSPFSQAASGMQESRAGVGTGQGVGREADYNETITETEKNQTGGTAFFMESVPPRYRDAVKIFYSEETP